MKRLMMVLVAGGLIVSAAALAEAGPRRDRTRAKDGSCVTQPAQKQDRVRARDGSCQAQVVNPYTGSGPGQCDGTQKRARDGSGGNCPTR